MEIMNIIQALLLGLVQGLTEFLPVSSSGHLTIFQSMLGDTKDNILFDLILHCGTVVATIIFFRARICSLFSQGTQELRNGAIMSGSAIKVVFFIIAATFVTGTVGVFFKNPLEELFARPDLVCLMLIVTGLLLLATKFVGPGSLESHRMGWPRAVIIGLVQGIAIIPGISRSGSTISAALFLKIKRETAGEFSFLISIPSIFGAVALKAKEIGAAQILAWENAGHWLFSVAGHRAGGAVCLDAVHQERPAVGFCPLLFTGGGRGLLVFPLRAEI